MGIRVCHQVAPSVGVSRECFESGELHEGIDDGLLVWAQVTGLEREVGRLWEVVLERLQEVPLETARLQHLGIDQRELIDEVGSRSPDQRARAGGSAGDRQGIDRHTERVSEVNSFADAHFPPAVLQLVDRLLVEVRGGDDLALENSREFSRVRGAI